MPLTVRGLPLLGRWTDKAIDRTRGSPAHACDCAEQGQGTLKCAIKPSRTFRFLWQDDEQKILVALQDLAILASMWVFGEENEPQRGQVVCIAARKRKGLSWHVSVESFWWCFVFASMNGSRKKVSMLNNHVVIARSRVVCLVERVGAHFVGMKRTWVQKLLSGLMSGHDIVHLWSVVSHVNHHSILAVPLLRHLTVFFVCLLRFPPTRSTSSQSWLITLTFSWN